MVSEHLRYPALISSTAHYLPCSIGGGEKKSNIEHRDDSVYKWFFVGGSVIPEGWKEKKNNKGEVKKRNGIKIDQTDNEREFKGRGAKSSPFVWAHGYPRQYIKEKRS